MYIVYLVKCIHTLLLCMQKSWFPLEKSLLIMLMIIMYFRSQVLNPDQMEAVKHIVAERTGYTPPFVIYGPFGTGKTETLAQAAMVLLKEKPQTRILICAQSNR